MSKNRIGWVDSLKGFAILCVIVGHSTMPQDIHAVIYSFHMPLFFFLSGFFLFTKPRTFREEVLNKVRSLLVPYAVFNVVAIINALFPLPDGGFPAIWKAFITPFLGMFVADRNLAYLWFLPCLFLAELILYPFSRRKTDWFLVSALLAVIGALVNHLVPRMLVFNLDNVLIASSFIALGKACKESLPENADVQVPAGALSSPWIIAVLTCIYAGTAWLNIRKTGGLGIDMYEDRYGSYCLFFIASGAILVCLAYGAKRISDRFAPESRILRFLGENSLIIYCTHRLLMTHLGRLFISLVPVLGEGTYLSSSILSVLVTAGVCACSWPIVWLIRKYMPWSIGRFRSCGRG